jgi:hypothetical protein
MKIDVEKTVSAKHPDLPNISSPIAAISRIFNTHFF